MVWFWFDLCLISGYDPWVAGRNQHDWGSMYRFHIFHCLIYFCFPISYTLFPQTWIFAEHQTICFQHPVFALLQDFSIIKTLVMFVVGFDFNNPGNGNFRLYSGWKKLSLNFRLNLVIWFESGQHHKCHSWPWPRSPPIWAPENISDFGDPSAP